MTIRHNNAFLRGLSNDSYAGLAGSLKAVDMPLASELFGQGETLDWVYFPEAGLLSMISAGGDGQQVETAMVGTEGAAGLLEACASGVSSVECLVQVDGRAWRSPAAHCRKLAAADPSFGASAWRMAELQFTESRQSGLCQALHSVEQRCARWLLESLERSGGRNPLPMTQEFLAAMLGVQRTTVSTVAAELQREGLIQYRRGQVEIVDKSRLEARACECRRITRGHRARLGLVAPTAEQMQQT